MNLTDLPVNDAFDADDWESVWSEAFPRRSAAPPFTIADIVAVEAWSGTNEDGGGTRDLLALLRLADGRYATLTAWADYTGWDCQSGAKGNIWDTRADAVWYGLTDQERTRLQLDNEDRP